MISLVCSNNHNTLSYVHFCLDPVVLIRSRISPSGDGNEWYVHWTECLFIQFNHCCHYYIVFVEQLIKDWMDGYQNRF